MTWKRHVRGIVYGTIVSLPFYLIVDALGIGFWQWAISFFGGWWACLACQYGSSE